MLFPGTEVLRMDADTVPPASATSSCWTRFERERIPILLGTQMVAKGLDFENVTLVGVSGRGSLPVCRQLPGRRADLQPADPGGGPGGPGRQTGAGGHPDLHPGKRCDPVRGPAGLRGVL